MLPSRSPTLYVRHVSQAVRASIGQQLETGQPRISYHRVVPVPFGLGATRYGYTRFPSVNIRFRAFRGANAERLGAEAASVGPKWTNQPPLTASERWPRSKEPRGICRRRRASY